MKREKEEKRKQDWQDKLLYRNYRRKERKNDMRTKERQKKNWYSFMALLAFGFYKNSSDMKSLSISSTMELLCMYMSEVNSVTIQYSCSAG